MNFDFLRIFADLDVFMRIAITLRSLLLLCRLRVCLRRAKVRS